MRILVFLILFLCAVSTPAPTMVVSRPLVFASSAFNTANLIAHWKLDEASGNRADSVGANTLTDNNTVTQTTGKVGNAAQFTRANSESLSIVDNADLSTGNIDFTVAGWVYLDSKPAALMVIAGKDDATSGGREWLLYWDNATDRFKFQTGRPASTSVDLVTANSFGAPSTATWYFIVAWHDATAGQVKICVNNGTVDSAARTSGPPDSSKAFRIGCFGSVTLFWDGRIDSVSFFKRTLTSGEITYLYNAGSGRDYPF